MTPFNENKNKNTRSMDEMVPVLAPGLICLICFKGQLWVLQKLAIIEKSEKLQQTLRSEVASRRGYFVHMADIPISSE